MMFGANIANQTIRVDGFMIWAAAGAARMMLGYQTVIVAGSRRKTGDTCKM